MLLNGIPHTDEARHRANAQRSIQAAFAACCRADIFYSRNLLDVIDNRRSIRFGPKTERASAIFQFVFRKTDLSAQMRSAFLSILVFYFIRTIFIKWNKKEENIILVKVTVCHCN